MTTAFSLVLQLEEMDDAASVTIQILHHAYLFCMMASGMLALKSVNDFLQEYLCLCNLPSKALPDFYRHKKERF
jgi:hypothetical protein